MPLQMLPLLSPCAQEPRYRKECLLCSCSALLPTDLTFIASAPVLQEQLLVAVVLPSSLLFSLFFSFVIAITIVTNITIVIINLLLFVKTLLISVKRNLLRP